MPAMTVTMPMKIPAAGRVVIADRGGRRHRGTRSRCRSRWPATKIASPMCRMAMTANSGRRAVDEQQRPPPPEMCSVKAWKICEMPVTSR